MALPCELQLAPPCPVTQRSEPNNCVPRTLPSTVETGRYHPLVHPELRLAEVSRTQAPSRRSTAPSCAKLPALLQYSTSPSGVLRSSVCSTTVGCCCLVRLSFVLHCTQHRSFVVYSDRKRKNSSKNNCHHRKLNILTKS